MPRPSFLLLLGGSSACGVVFPRCCNLPTWGGQHQCLHSILGIVAYFCVNYKFFDRRGGRKGDKKRQIRDLALSEKLSGNLRSSSSYPEQKYQ